MMSCESLGISPAASTSSATYAATVFDHNTPRRRYLCISSGSLSFPRLHLNLPRQQQCWNVSTDLGRLIRRPYTLLIHCASIPPPTGLPSVPFPPVDLAGSWKGLLVGTLTVLSIILSLFKSKWSPIYRLLNEVETVIDRVEDVVEVVEHMAEGVDKVAHAVADSLPEGSRLKKAANMIEHYAEVIDKEAEIIEHAIDKIQEVEEKLESFIDEASHHQRSSKDTNP